jgi:hypothetical protein
MQRKIRLISFVFLFLFVACAVGRKDPNGTYADSLNGEHSKSGMFVTAGVPVFLSDPAPVQRRITGRIFCGRGIDETVVRHGDVALITDGKVAANASWKDGGIFAISAVFNRNVAYTVKVKVACGEASKPVPLNLLSDLTDFDFHMQDLTTEPGH